MSQSASTQAHKPLPRPAAISLTDRAVIRVSGAQADTFLQGQFSQNLADVTEAFSPRAAACNPKGRAYCLTRLVRDGEDVLLDLPVESADAITGHLRKYLMLFRGTTMAVEESARITGLLGDEIADRLYPAAAQQLLRPGDSVKTASGHLIRTENTADGLARYEFWQTRRSDSSPLDTATGGSLADWYGSEIAAGVARLTLASHDAYVPQMLNWQHVGGIHFKKGCYTGQEVVARAHFRGQVKRRLMRGQLDGSVLPEIGSPVLDTNDKAVGEVITTELDAYDQAEVLVVLSTKEDIGPLNVAGQKLKLLQLPYPIERLDPESLAAS